MPLQQVKFAPGIDKQNTTVGAQGRWIDSDNVRFRYGLPEKVSGWSSLVTDTIVGVSRKLHAFVDISGNRYVAIGTDKFLLLYFEGQLYDITPLRATLSSATIATTSGSAVCTITTGSAHGLIAGDIVLLDNVTLPGGTGYTDADFEDKLFQVTSVGSTTTFTITQATNATATVATGGSIDVKPYENIGPAEQSYGYGWGTDTWGSGGWGDASSAQDVILEPGLWSLDNFGQVLIATIANGKTFTWLPEETLHAVKDYVVSIKGPLTTPVGGGIRSLNVALRQQLDLYVCQRPVRWFTGVPSPVKKPGDVDMVIFRENSEDIYAGVEFKAGTPEAKKIIKFLQEEMGVTKIRFTDMCGIGVKPVSEEGTKRLVQKALQYAVDNDRKSVTIVHKGNIMKFTEGAFKEWCPDK